jgi:alpha-D-ribose 1-methylphosphonate 5-triphosphate synthase subunit PhnH
MFDSESTDGLQALFRNILGAMSYPGTIRSVAEDIHGPGALLISTAACLIDHETTFGLIGDHPSDRVHTLWKKTCATQAELMHADFIFVDGNSSKGLAGEAKRGTLANPDSGATLIYQLPSTDTADFDSRLLNAVVFSGPGIRDAVSPPAGGLDIKEFELLREINADYPLGVDAIIIWGNTHIMAIPRSTRIEVN